MEHHQLGDGIVEDVSALDTPVPPIWLHKLVLEEELLARRTLADVGRGMSHQ
jgi:hypothetical protein